jgi:uncharacterized protein
MSTRPAPTFSAVSAPYWEAARAGRLELQRCETCRLWIHFPDIRCPNCRGTALSFEPVSGRGVVSTFTIVHRKFVPGFEDEESYAVGWIDLPEQDGLRVFADIVGIESGAIRIGLPVRVTFTDRVGWGPVPSFEPIPADEDAQQ